MTVVAATWKQTCTSLLSTGEGEKCGPLGQTLELGLHWLSGVGTESDIRQYVLSITSFASQLPTPAFYTLDTGASQNQLQCHSC